MAAVFSRTFITLDSVPTGIYASPTVPDGVCWIIKLVTAVSTNSENLFGAGSFNLSKSDHTRFLGAFGPYVRTGFPFSIESRHRVEPGDYFNVSVDGDGWIIDVSGFELTLP